jgi:hypothetical protein
MDCNHQTNAQRREGGRFLSITIDRRVARFRGVLIFSGLFNILLAAPLMVPEYYRNYLSFLWTLNGMLSLQGKEPVVPTGGIGALLVNTAGIDLVLIGIIVLYAAAKPLSRRFIPAVNGFARMVFAGVVYYYVSVYDVAHIVLVIGIIDLLISSVFVWYLIALRHVRSL